MPDSTIEVRLTTDDSPTQPSPASEPGWKSRRNRRSDYVAQACMNCRNRKVKCSGAPLCDACERLGETCTFTLAKRKRGSSSRTAGQHISPVHVPASQASFAPDHVFDRMVDLNQRLFQLEQTYSEIHSALSVDATDATAADQAITPTEEVEQTAPPEASSRVIDQAQDHQIVDEITTEVVASQVAPPTAVIHDLSQPGNSITSNNAFEAQSEYPATSAINTTSNPRNVYTRPADAGAYHFPEPNHASTQLSSSEMFQEVKLNNGAKFRRSFDLYFEFLNPLHPIINENAFYQCFDDLVFEEAKHLSESDVPQFLILVHLLYAEVTLLHSMCTDSGPLPGWREFTYANETLTRLLPSARPNVTIVVCLILSTRYLLEIGDHGQAYDTMSSALRIAVQIGLHDQTTWKPKCSDFDVVMRQRVFWCLLILDQAISQSCGLSYRLRPNEYYVELPRAIDDRCLFPNRKLPQENFEASFAPALNALIAWASLAKRAWDEALCVTKKKTQTFAAISALDGELARFLEQLPPFWRVPSGEARLIGLERTELVLRRHRTLLRVRVNTQRLLIHLESLKKPGMPAIVAEKVVAIAQDSVDTMVASSNDLNRQPQDRYIYTVCLAGVFSPLSSVLLASHVTAAVQSHALAVFHKAHDILGEMSKGFRLATTVLQKSQSIIDMINSVGIPNLVSADLPAQRYSMPRNESYGQLGMVSDAGNETGDVANPHAATHNDARHAQAGMLVSHFPTPAPDSDLLAPVDGHGLDADWIVTPW